ncbi:MAG TPA: hypothetical protein VOA87_10000 [Thermoanaerobaculia bacterium]|nr:hypothetical protein [Thermoanaerobaculia bacterium]
MEKNGSWMRRLAYASLIAILTMAALPAAAQVTLGAGDDGWVTTGGGQTSVDLTYFPIKAFFGSDPTNPVVNLKGQPLSSSLGSIDTIVNRPNATTIPGLNQPTTTVVQVKALSLVSEASVQIGAKSYNLNVFNSHLGSATGTMTLTQTNGDGGTYNSSFDVTPRLKFTNVSNPSDIVVIDCGAVSPHCNDALITSNAAWVRTGGAGNFQPSSQGATPLNPGIAVDGDGDGTNDYTTVGQSNFYAGYSSVTPFPPVSSPHNHQAQQRFHQTLPPTDCKIQQAGASKAATAQAQAIIRICKAVIQPQ